MKQMAKLAQAIVHGPQLVVLDEPTNGLDPAARRRMLKLIAEMKNEQGINVLVCSHLLRDIEQVCDEAVILKDGNIVQHCDLEEERRSNRSFVELEVTGDDRQLRAALPRDRRRRCVGRPGPLAHRLAAGRRGGRDLGARQSAEAPGAEADASQGHAGGNLPQSHGTSCADARRERGVERRTKLMAVYKRGYRRYEGPLTGRWARFLVLPRYAWRRLYQQRLVLLLTILAFVWPILCAGFVYLTNHVELLQGLDREFREFIQVDGRFFAVFMYVQGGFAVFIAALAGPGLIAPDLANNALPLYFSRPLTRWSYALARLTVLVGMLSVVTWIPGVILFGLQVVLAGGSWFRANWTLGAGMVVGFAVWLLILSLVAMASSAYREVEGRRGRREPGLLLHPERRRRDDRRGVAREWGHVIDPVWAVNQVWFALLGVAPNEGPSAGAAAWGLAAIILLLVVVIERKLRPVEVVS